MHERNLKKKLKKTVLLFKENPLLVLFAVITALLAFFFWRAILLTAATLIAGFAIALLAIKIYFRKPSLRQLLAKKRRLLEAIKIAEHRYMRRKLSEQDFNRIFKEKQKELIKLEALIDQQYNKERAVALSNELKAVQAKKRHILHSLLGEKKRILREIGIAEKRYLRRKIDSKTYQDLVQKNQETLIELEAQIKQLYSEANIQQVMLSLKQRLRDLELQKKKKKKEREKSEREKEMQIAAEIAQQLMKE